MELLTHCTAGPLHFEVDCIKAGSVYKLAGQCELLNPWVCRKITHYSVIWTALTEQITSILSVNYCLSGSPKLLLIWVLSRDSLELQCVQKLDESLWWGWKVDEMFHFRQRSGLQRATILWGSWRRSTCWRSTAPLRGDITRRKTELIANILTNLLASYCCCDTYCDLNFVDLLVPHDA